MADTFIVRDITGKLQTVNATTPTGGTTVPVTAANSDLSSFVSNEANIVNAGSPVYNDGANTVRRAVANIGAKALVIGLANSNISPNTSGNIKTGNEMVLTTSQWDGVTGKTGGLVSGANYFLSNSIAGMITNIIPTTGFVVQVGKALSSTRMFVHIGNRVQL